MKSMTTPLSATLLAVICFCCPTSGWTAEPASEVISNIRNRFEDEQTAETPDFQKHVVPLMGRLGCNGRACHGSFQGQGGFQLSLFGYDFDMDHKGMLERIDTDAPVESYALQKATMVEPHEGGKRMDVGSWEYRIFLNWIKAGAKEVDEPVKLERLEVTPTELVFDAAGQTKPLTAVAVWADGSREDVTPLCRYTTNDELICAINEEGIVTSGEMGDSNVVVAYDMAVVPVSVIRPVSEQTGDMYPQLATKTAIDSHVVDKLRKLGVIPSDLCDDAEFLRRVTLDMTASLPTANQVREFLSDSTPDKRARKIDELLETPAYAAWWTTQLCDWTGCSDEQLNNVVPGVGQRGSQIWYDWIYDRVSKNVAYDDLMENIVVANSRRENESYEDYCKRLTTYAREKDESFADQEGLFYFWGRRNFLKDEDRAIGFAYTFMGTRIQCAQCHKHPFDVWTQKDFTEFEDFFTRVQFSRTGTDKAEYAKLIKELGVEKLNGNDQRRAIEKQLNSGKTLPFPELVIRPSRNTNTKKGKAAPAVSESNMARLLGEQEVNLEEIEDPRTALMDWLRNSPTKLFAKAFVNRVWANYFNRGIVEPTDDLSLANPPSNPALLAYLTDGFIANNYDMKWLHREICLSDTYQRSWKPNDTNVHDDRNFSRAVPRRLPAETAFDALTIATTNDQRASEFCSNLEDRATVRSSPPRNSATGTDYALSVFGRSLRESNCDCDRSSEASLLQTLFVRNDKDMLLMLETKSGWVNQIAKEIGASTNENEKGTEQVEILEKRQAKLERSIKQLKKSGNEKQVARLEEQLLELQNANSIQPRTENSRVDFEPAKIIEEAYLRTLSRYPTKDETQLAATYLTSAEDSVTGVRDLMWALINTKEFMVNH